MEAEAAAAGAVDWAREGRAGVRSSVAARSGRERVRRRDGEVGRRREAGRGCMAGRESGVKETKGIKVRAGFTAMRM
jgi:hypothetical protein